MEFAQVLLLAEFTPGTWTDIEPDVRISSGIILKYANQETDPTSFLGQTGRLNFTLDNSEVNSAGLLGYYSIRHANKRAGWDKGLPIRLLISHGTNKMGSKLFGAGTFDDMYEKFSGRLASVEPSIGRYREREAACEARDWMDIAARQAIGTLAVQLEKRVDEILPEIFAKCSVQPPRTYLQTGRTTFPQAMDVERGTRTKIQTALSKLALSELGHIYMRGGTLAEGYALYFENRDHRLGPQTPIITLNDSMEDLKVVYRSDNVWNSVRASVYPRDIDATPTSEIASLEKALWLNPGETKVFTLEYKDPQNIAQSVAAIEVQTPVAGTNYCFGVSEGSASNELIANLGATWDISGASIATITVVNNGTRGGFLSKFKLYGRVVRTNSPITADEIDSPSALSTGDMQKTIDMPYETRPVMAKAVAVYYLGLKKGWDEEINSVTFLANRDAAHMVAALSGEPGKPFAITETATGISKTFFINGVELRISQGNLIRCTWTCIPADTAAYWQIGSTIMSEALMAPF